MADILPNIIIQLQVEVEITVTPGIVIADAVTIALCQRPGVVNIGLIVGGGGGEIDKGEIPDLFIAPL